jgi:hypothetical protein
MHVHALRDSDDVRRHHFDENVKSMWNKFIFILSDETAFHGLKRTACACEKLKI